MPTAHSTTGARKHVRGIIPDAVNRPALDFYRTPPLGTRRLLVKEMIPGPVWEPACGDGTIVSVLRENNVKVFASDIVDRGCPDSTSAIDFLTAAPPDEFEYRSIVTNPPYTHCEEFARRALELVRPGGKVAMLCRLLWLEGKTRRLFFEASPLWKVYVFSGRINIARNGDTGYGPEEGGMVAFAWFVWRPGYQGSPFVDWI